VQQLQQQVAPQHRRERRLQLQRSWPPIFNWVPCRRRSQAVLQLQAAR
jgi:hypothetical protein